MVPREVIEIAHFDVERDAEYAPSTGGEAVGAGEEGQKISRHLAAFHAWHNFAPERGVVRAFLFYA